MRGEALLNLFKICEPAFAADPGVSQAGCQIVLATLPMLNPREGKLRVTADGIWTVAASV